MCSILPEFAFLFWNCAHGVKSKFDYIKYLISSWNVSILFIFEAEVKPDDISVLQIEGYDLIVSNTISGDFKKARTVCFIKNDLPYKVLKVEGDAHRFIGLYRGFKLHMNESQNSYFFKMLGIITKLSQTNKQIFIGGDFNVDLFRKSNLLDHLENWAFNMGLNQLINNYTRDRVVNKDDGSISHEQSAIDHFYSNSDDVKLYLENSVSDHKILLGTINCIKKDPRIKSTV